MASLEPVLREVALPHRIGVKQTTAPVMRYWQWGDANADHVVMCVHGLTLQGRYFDEVAKGMLVRAAKQDIALRVVCPDIVGRGKSDWLTEPAGYSPPWYAADCAALITQLNAQSPIKALDWVGTSMGGLIAFVVAGQPEKQVVPIRRLILNDVGPVIDWAFLERLKTTVGRLGSFATVEDAAKALWRVQSDFGPHTDEQWLALCQHQVKLGADGRWIAHYDPAMAVPFQTITPEQAKAGEAAAWHLYESIQAETLIVRGGVSDMTSVATVQDMLARAKGMKQPPKTVDIPGVGHAPTLVDAAQQKIVCDFLFGNV